MDLQYDGKVVLVTGGGGRLGRAVVSAFAREGAKVAIADLKAEAGSESAGRVTDSGGMAVAVSGDVSAPADVERMVAEVTTALGPIDVLVNSAGAAKRTPPDELTPAAWHAAMDAKYFSYIHVIDPAIKRMAARRSGVIVNIIGTGGKIAAPPSVVALPPRPRTSRRYPRSSAAPTSSPTPYVEAVRAVCGSGAGTCRRPQAWAVSR